MLLLHSLLVVSVFLGVCTIPQEKQQSYPHILSYTPTDFKLLAEAEQSVVAKLKTYISQNPMFLDPEFVSELEYFLDFIVEDGGTRDLDHPVLRFKLIERVLYDWPQMVGLVSEGEIDVDVMEELFTRSGISTPPTHNHLLATVQDLNDIISYYNISHHSVKTGSSPLGGGWSSVPLNTGNTLLLTNFSRDLGHMEHCVRWGEETDRDLMTSPEPFAVPGEDFWIHFYITYLECLVVAERTSKHKLKINEIKNEILYHYSHLKSSVKKILKKSVTKSSEHVLNGCHGNSITVDGNASCRSMVFPFFNIYKLEELQGSVYRLYGVSSTSCHKDLPFLLGFDGVVCNLGALSQDFAFNSWVVRLQSGEGLLFTTKEEFLRPCPLLQGVSYFRYYHV